VTKHHAERAPVRAAPKENRPDEAFDPDRWDMLSHSGWQYLLDLRRSDTSVLCYDCKEGATSLLLSRLYRQVTVVNARAEQLEKIERRLALEGVTAARYRIVRRAADFLAPGEPPFDGIVIHDLEASIVRRAQDGEELMPLQDLLDAAFAALAPDGFAYIGMRNRLSYLRVRDGWRNAANRRALTADAVRRALAAAGFGAVAAYQLLLEGTRVAEIIPRGGYRSASARSRLGRNSSKLRSAGGGRPVLRPATAWWPTRTTCPASRRSSAC